ncbi:MAG TPA: hypothetical protein VH591_15460 [Ktedonobacterales bacterium]
MTRTTHRLAAAIVFVSLLVMLLGCGSGASAGSSRPKAPAATPTATIEPVTQAYLTVLRQYYMPFLGDETLEKNRCGIPALFGSLAVVKSLMSFCGQFESKALASAQTLLDHLKTVTPPTQWKTADEKLKQAIQVTITFHAKKLQAINTQNAAQYKEVNGTGPVMAGLYCDPIGQINAGLPLSSALPVPEQSACS